MAKRAILHLSVRFEDEDSMSDWLADLDAGAFLPDDYTEGVLADGRDQIHVYDDGSTHTYTSYTLRVTYCDAPHMVRPVLEVED